QSPIVGFGGVMLSDETTKLVRVTVVFHGVLAGWAGAERIELALPEGAGVGDLWAEIGRVLGPVFHPQLWDREKNRFKPPVLALSGERRLADPAGPLADGDTVDLVLLPTGG
ncbi:MAG: hypothetical protein AB1896_15460, partial [Thermodesulfobacteriota bacterium]